MASNNNGKRQAESIALLDSVQGQELLPAKIPRLGWMASVVTKMSDPLSVIFINEFYACL